MERHTSYFPSAYHCYPQNCSLIFLKPFPLGCIHKGTMICWYNCPEISQAFELKWELFVFLPSLSLGGLSELWINCAMDTGVCAGSGRSRAGRAGLVGSGSMPCGYSCAASRASFGLKVVQYWAWANTPCRVSGDVKSSQFRCFHTTVLYLCGAEMTSVWWTLLGMSSYLSEPVGVSVLNTWNLSKSSCWSWRSWSVCPCLL